jgi:GntR family phosphonate transport system transcriptional regulator
MPAPHKAKSAFRTARAGKPKSSVGKRRDTGGLPLWRSAAQRLEHDIVSGQLHAGSRLASETVLARQFGINRHTLRRAIAELVKKGLVRPGPEPGNYVAPLHISFQIGPTTHLADAIQATGFTTTARLISERITTAPAEISKRLAVALRTPVIELNFVRYANDIPITFVTAWLPADRFAGISKLLELTGSLRRAIVKAGIPELRRMSTRIIARSGTEDECRELEIDPGSMLLTLEVTNADLAGEPAAVFLSRFPAMRAEFFI